MQMKVPVIYANRHAPDAPQEETFVIENDEM